MHSVTLSRLQSFEDQARQANNPRLFLQLLSPLHAQWHARQARRVGFLIFLWHVSEHFEALGLGLLLEVDGVGRSETRSSSLVEAIRVMAHGRSWRPPPTRPRGGG